MRRHHEAQTAAAVLPALSMLIPTACLLWARLVSLRRTSERIEKAKDANEQST